MHFATKSYRLLCTRLLGQRGEWRESVRERGERGEREGGERGKGQKYKL